jgi:hypothetical protein
VNEEARRRAQRLRRVFGDVLPDTTGDEQSEEQNDHDSERDEWYRDNRPPHHDDPR